MMPITLRGQTVRVLGEWLIDCEEDQPPSDHKIQLHGRIYHRPGWCRGEKSDRTDIKAVQVRPEGLLVETACALYLCPYSTQKTYFEAQNTEYLFSYLRAADPKAVEGGNSLELVEHMLHSEHSIPWRELPEPCRLLLLDADGEYYSVGAVEKRDGGCRVLERGMQVYRGNLLDQVSLLQGAIRYVPYDYGYGEEKNACAMEFTHIEEPECPLVFFNSGKVAILADSPKGAYTLPPGGWAAYEEAPRQSIAMSVYTGYIPEEDGEDGKPFLPDDFNWPYDPDAL